MQTSDNAVFANGYFPTTRLSRKDIPLQRGSDEGIVPYNADLAKGYSPTARILRMDRGLTKAYSPTTRISQIGISQKKLLLLVCLPAPEERQFTAPVADVSAVRHLNTEKRSLIHEHPL